jgi:cysteine-rich repeat protein
MRLTWAVLVFSLTTACGDNLTRDRPPQLADFQLVTSEDLAVTRALDASDPDGDPLVIQFVTPMHGSVTIAGTQLTYMPAPDFHGEDRFTLTASDGTTEVSAAVTVTVTPVNDAPVGVADSLAADEDTARVVAQATLLQNDSDVDGDPLTVTEVGNATNGTVAITGTDVTFTPAADFVGLATFDYTVSDGTDLATVPVSVAVGGLNDPPVAVDDVATTAEDTPLDLTSATLVGNDTDPEGQALSVTAVSDATNGSVALVGSTVTFTPAADFSGTATFTYTVSDGVATDTGLVTITVTPVNDAPVAVDDTGTTAEDTAVDFTAATLTGNDTDVDGAGLTVTAVASSVSGSVVLNGTTATFTPAANFTGLASFEYTVSDGTLTDTGVVTITVTAVNDAPVAVDDTATTAEDTALDLTAATLVGNDTDPDGPGLAVTAVANATNGTVALVGTTATFTPASNFSGIATFEYTVSDGTLADTGLVTITVTAVNDAPVAADDLAAVQAGNSLVVSHATLLANDSDLDGDPLSITAVQTAVNGSVTLEATTITFTPTAGFVGNASFEYVVFDGTVTDIGRVDVTVGAGPVCGDGTIAAPETCDDGNANPGDGCSAACQLEPGFSCTGTPTVCASICNDGIVVAGEACDDGNPVDTDGCTTQCQLGTVCTAAAFPGGNDFAVDPATGHCYVSFDGTQTTFAGAEAACVGTGGYLTTITSASEQLVVESVLNPLENPWIGATDDANDTDAVFDWVTDEPFTFAHFEIGQPDDDAGLGGNGECLHIANATGLWNDTNCDITTFVVGRICEIEPTPCGDSVAQPFEGEECDDGNTAAGDGCSATCQRETGCGNGLLEAGEECDDDNIVDGDTCSATCQLLEGCGDGNLDAGEQCDDDNVASGDGCSSTCKVENVCGNGVLELGEQCDDGNLASGDGCSLTCHVETLFFSEYVEGSSSNKALEIKNPFTTAFDLTGCSIQTTFNGGTSPATFTLTGTIAPNDVLVVCNALAGVLLAPHCDVTTTSTALTYNGDDALSLKCGTTTLDVIGQVGFDPGTEWGTGATSTADNTLRRACDVPADPNGTDLFDPITQWAGFAVDTFDGLGDPACSL